MSVQADIFYDFHPVLSRAAIFNYIVGGRGIGKTYGAKKLVIKDHLKNGKQFIYVRRFREELQIAANTFFADVAIEFPELRFRRKGMEAQYTKDVEESKGAVWVTCGYFIPLSTAQSVKSVAFPKVKTIIYDEFIPEKGRRYLNDEVNIFLNFYNTVARMREDVRVLFLANAVSIMDKYLLEYDIEPFTGKPRTYRDGFVCAHFPDSEKYAKRARQTRFGKFIAGTAYEDYSISNQFKDNKNTLVAKKSAEARYLYSVKTPKGAFSLWLDTRRGLYFAQEKQPGNAFYYTVELAGVDEDTLYLEPRAARLDFPRRAFKRGELFCDSPKTRNKFLELFK